MSIDDDNRNRMIDIERRLSALEGGAFLEKSSITDGRLRVIRGQILIEQGRLTVQGLIEGAGNIKWQGRAEFTGDVELLGGGNLKVGDIVLTPDGNGAVTIGTAMKITGDGRLEAGGPSGVVIDGPSGKLTVGTNIELDANGVGLIKVGEQTTIDGTGKIEAGNVIIDPSDENGGIRFRSGGWLYGITPGVTLQGNGGNLLSLYADGTAALSSPDGIAMHVGSTGSIDLDGDTNVDGAFKVSGNVVFDELPLAPPGSSPNIWINPDTGQMYRI